MLRALDSVASDRAGARRRIQRRARRRSDRPDRRAAGQHRDHRRRQRAARRGRRGVGRRRGHRRWRTVSAGWNACRASPARPVRRRCRTSAPTAPRSPTPSAGCGCWTGAPARSAGLAATARVRLPDQRAEEFATPPSCSRWSSRWTPTGAARRCATASWPTALGAEPGSRADPARVREAVLALRTRKGMVLDDADHDTWSVGSFFTNPVVTPGEFERLQDRRRRAGPELPGARRGEAGRGLAGGAGRLRQGLSRVRTRRPGCRPSMRWR